MAIVKQDELIGWDDGNKIICVDCGDPCDAKPLTENDFEDTDIVTCDNCNTRIQQL